MRPSREYLTDDEYQWGDDDMYRPGSGGAAPRDDNGVLTGAPAGVAPGPSAEEIASWGPPEYNPNSNVPVWWGGGGGSGGGSARSGGSSSVEVPDYGQEYEQIIGDYLKGALNGENSRWNPAAWAAAQSQIKGAAEGSARSARENAQWNLIQTGMNQSGQAARTYSDIDRAKGQQYTDAMTKLTIQKANDDYNDKKAALESMKEYLSQIRAFQLSRANTALERDRINANMAIAWANIEAEEKSLAQSAQQFQANMAYNYDLLDWQKQQNLVPIQTADGRTVYVPINVYNELQFS
jgi:hypothetical protein